MKIVVVGYGAAGMTAASYAALTNRKAEIIAFEKRSYAVYHPCSLPDLISGIVKSPEHLKEPPPRLPRLKVYTSTVVKEIKRGEFFKGLSCKDSFRCRNPGEKIKRGFVFSGRKDYKAEDSSQSGS